MFSCHWIFFVWSDLKESFNNSQNARSVQPIPNADPDFFLRCLFPSVFLGLGRGEGVLPTHRVFVQQKSTRPQSKPRYIRRVDTRQFVHRHGDFVWQKHREPVCSLGPLCFQPLKNGRSYQSFRLGVNMWHRFCLELFGKKMRHVYLSRKQAMTVMQCLTTHFLENWSLFSTRLNSTSACTISRHETGNHDQSAMFDGRKASISVTARCGKRHQQPKPTCWKHHGKLLNWDCWKRKSINMISLNQQLPGNSLCLFWLVKWPLQRLLVTSKLGVR